MFYGVSLHCASSVWNKYTKDLLGTQSRLGSARACIWLYCFAGFRLCYAHQGSPANQRLCTPLPWSNHHSLSTNSISLALYFWGGSFLKKIYLFICLFIYNIFEWCACMHVCMYVCVPQACLLPIEVRRETEPRSCVWVTSAFEPRSCI